MANYTLAINWSGKDALSDTDPSKVISGSDFNTEFTTAQTAINTKAELNGSSSEAFSISTESASSNTTVAASTSYVTSAITTLALGTASTQGYFVSATEPSGTLESGDVWYQT
jgi:hypothetical protein